MANTPSVYIDTIIHSTEDADKIFGSLHQTLGTNPDIFDISQTRGHYRNPIILATATLRKKDAVQFIKVLCNKLGPYQRDEIIRTASTRIKNSSLYLRLDRQDIIRSGDVILRDSGTIRIKIHTPIHAGRAEDVFADLLCRY